jgi:proton-translocating NADH-quinone oxidoreductase chain M
MLTFVIFFPLAGALLIATLPKEQEQTAKYIAALASAIVLAVVAYLFIDYDRDQAGYQFIDSAKWLRSDFSDFDLDFAVGVDGLSLPLVMLTAFLGLVAVLISWRIELRPKEYFAWLLVLETSLLGVFSSLDMVLFFLFWEVELVPMYFLISVWGSGNRIYSAWKYVLYTFFGSAFMIVGILTLGFTAGTFDIRELAQAGPFDDAIIPAWTIFTLLSIAFLIKLPIVPFHTWLPDAHTDAPTAVSVILAGVLLKMGGYGIQHPLRRADDADPDGPQAPDRLLLGEPHGLRATRRVLHRRRRPDGRGDADGDARPDHRHAVHARRHGLRPRAHPRHRRAARPGDAHAVHHGDDGGRRPGFAPAAQPCRFRR